MKVYYRWKSIKVANTPWTNLSPEKSCAGVVLYFYLQGRGLKTWRHIMDYHVVRLILFLLFNFPSAPNYTKMASQIDLIALSYDMITKVNLAVIIPYLEGKLILHRDRNNCLLFPCMKLICGTFLLVTQCCWYCQRYSIFEILSWKSLVKDYRCL